MWKGPVKRGVSSEGNFRPGTQKCTSTYQGGRHQKKGFQEKRRNNTEDVPSEGEVLLTRTILGV